MIMIGETPLGYAVVKGTVNTVRYLLDHGANPDKPSGDRSSAPLHLAVAEDVFEMLQHIRTTGRPFVPFTDTSDKIHATHREKCVKLLIEGGADLKGVGSANPIIVAITEGLTESLKCLIKAGADPNVLDDLGRLPIEVAASLNSRAHVKILFPLTSRIPFVREWSIDGIIAYVKSAMEDDPILKMNPANMKLEANKAYRRKDYVTAARLYHAALGYFREDKTLISNRSLCWLKMGEGDKALRDAQICRRRYGDWPKACFLEGAARMLLKDYEKARDAFVDGLKLDTGNTEIENALREALHSLKMSHDNRKDH
uniref:Uncharacterized protein n=1 Tax=Avena sativa TaxID=4498 RepID=A0ACD6AJ36_AVESA